MKTYIAIDSPTTRDVDDAIALNPATGDAGGWTASILIANPAAFVPIGSAEDAFARRQGATVYMGQRSVQSMLPRKVSEHDAALAADKVRPVMRVDLSISENFDVTVQELKFTKASIHAHVPYTTVAERARNTDDPLHQTLVHMIAVSRGLLGSRRNHGALAYYDLNRLLFLDEEGRMQQAKNKDDAIGQVLVQEFMILANAAIAAWAVERDVPILFRNHHAKNAAPLATDLVETMQSWLSGTALNEQAAREHLDMILGVASYGPSLTGHYALNLPAYTHATSPIRRYADLVTQRQLHAAAAGETLPYSKQDLEEIASEVNETLAKRKQERRDGFKDTIVRRATRALDSQRFDTLADHELSQAIKLASDAGDYPDAMVSTVVDRIRQGTLSDKVFDRLLSAPPGTIPVQIGHAWADHLAQSPFRSGHLINYGLQAGIFSDYMTSPARASADTGPFVDHATIKRLADGQHLTATAKSHRKQDAQNLAAAGLIAAHLGVTLPRVHASNTAPADNQASAVATNYKGRLQERCQLHRWAMPRYETRMEGPSNAASFYATVSLVVVGQPFTASNPHPASTRIAAEQAAAEALLAILPAPQAKASTTSAAANPIGALQEAAQKAGLPLPTYTVEDAGDGGFTCTVQTALCPIQTFSAKAPAKADAKRLAASAALAAVNESTTSTAA